jgi:hypothetical protein
MAVAACSQAAFDAEVSAPRAAPVTRAAFEAFFTHWMPRVHRFVAARIASRAEIEAATRAVLEAGIRGGLVAAGPDAGPRLLALAKAEIVRRRASQD